MCAYQQSILLRTPELTESEKLLGCSFVAASSITFWFAAGSFFFFDREACATFFGGAFWFAGSFAALWLAALWLAALWFATNRFAAFWFTANRFATDWLAVHRFANNHAAATGTTATTASFSVRRDHSGNHRQECKSNQQFHV